MLTLPCDRVSGDHLIRAIFGAAQLTSDVVK
jgi:hypothetical protein